MLTMANADTSDSDSNNSENDLESSTGEDVDVDALERRVMELKHSLSINPYIYDQHTELIKLLGKLGELDDLRSARTRMNEYYPLTEELWLSWLRDEVKYCEDNLKIGALFDKAVNDYLSITIWLEYCQFAIGAFLSDSPEKVRDIIDRSLAACGNHITNGSQIWEVSREFEIAILQFEEAKSGAEKDKFVTLQKARIENAFKAQLSVPLFDMESTLAEYCHWLESNNIDKNTKTAYENALKMLRAREPYEEQLLESNPPSLKAYTDYLSFEEEHGDPPRTVCLYERAVKDHPLQEDLWRHFGAYVDRKLIHGLPVVNVYERAVRNVPWSAEMWIKWAQAAERAKLADFGHSKLSKMFEDALSAGFQNEHDVAQVWVAYLDYLRRRIDWENSHDQELIELRECFQRAENSITLMNDKRELLPQVLKYWAFVEAKFCEKIDRARELWHLVTKMGKGNQADLWLEYINFEKAFGKTPENCISVFQSALNAVVDRPEAIFEAYINYTREACTLEQLDEAISACEKRKSVLKKRLVDQAVREKSKAAKSATVKQPNESKAKSVDIKKQHPSTTVSLDQKRKLGKSADGPLEGESPFKKPFAPPSKVEHQNVAKSSTEASKPSPSYLSEMDSSENATTVFLSNLDFNVTEPEIHEFFSSCGDLSEIRLVMKSQTQNRGFAYVKFSNLSAAQKALAMDRQKIRNRPAFVSSYNDNKQASSGGGLPYSASLEKNKLFLRNVPENCTEQKLRDTFSNHGAIKAARIVTFKDGRPKGIAYVEFESNNAAEKARLATNGTAALGEGKILSVEISNPPAKRPAGDLGGKALPSGRKGTVAAFYSNLGVGSRQHTQGSGQQTRIAAPDSHDKAAPSANSDASTAAVGKAKMSNEEFRKFLMK